MVEERGTSEVFISGILIPKIPYLASSQLRISGMHFNTWVWEHFEVPALSFHTMSSEASSNLEQYFYVGDGVWQEGNKHRGSK